MLTYCIVEICLGGSSSSDSSLPFGNGGADEKKMQALQTILAFNAEQARKRAAQGGDQGSAGGGGPSGHRSRFSASNDDDDDDARGRKRKRRSRWGGGEEDKTFIPGLPTMMPQGLNKAQEEAYLRKSDQKYYSREFIRCD